MRKGSIYIIRNNKNSLVYIGQTLGPIKDRLNGHKRKAKQEKFKNKFYEAIRDIGESEFYISSIEENVDETCIDEREVYWISFYDSYNKGYNSTKGGDGKYFSNIDEKTIINQYLSGLSAASISRKYDVSYNTIIRILKRNSIEIRGFNKIENTDEFTKDYLSGMSLKDISNKYQIDHRTISRYRERLGIAKRRENHKKVNYITNIDVEEFKKDYYRGIKLKELARKYDINEKTVRNFRDKLGLKKRKTNSKQKV